VGGPPVNVWRRSRNDGVGETTTSASRRDVPPGPGDTREVILNTYAGDFDRASRADSIREKIAAGTSIRLT
jgi:hypothetical protein